MDYREYGGAPLNRNEKPIVEGQWRPIPQAKAILPHLEIEKFVMGDITGDIEKNTWGRKSKPETDTESEMTDNELMQNYWHGVLCPESVYDNAYMESIVDTSDEWIVQRTGGKRRHICADDQFTTDIATEAAKGAQHNMPADELELIIPQRLHRLFYAVMRVRCTKEHRGG